MLPLSCGVLMSVSERVAVVLGGAGTVGSGIVKSLLEKGFQVAVISRDRSRLEKLKHFLPASLQDRLHTLVGDVDESGERPPSQSKSRVTPSALSRLHAPLNSTLEAPLRNAGSEEGAEAAREAVLKTLGKVTDVVSCLGFSWWQEGPPHTQSLEELQRVLDMLLLSTFTSWKAFFPLVRDNPSGSYTLITGGAGERLLLPGTGFLTLGAAGALAFCRVLREEYPEIPCKLNEVKINMGVRTPERLGPGYVSHLEVGGAVASLVEKRCVSHAVLTASSPADLKTLTVEGKL